SANFNDPDPGASILIGTVSIIDGQTNNLIKTTGFVGVNPYALEYNFQENKVYCANSGSNDLSMINGRDEVNSPLQLNEVQFQQIFEKEVEKVLGAGWSSGKYDRIIWVRPRYPSWGASNPTVRCNPVTQVNDLLSTLVGATAHEYGHGILGLLDKYDSGKGNFPFNPYTASEVVGIYSPMEITAYHDDPVRYTRPYSPYDKIYLCRNETQKWIEPIDITDNKDNLSVEDYYSTGDIYRIPFWNPTTDPTPPASPDKAKSYFLILNHQKENRWEKEFPRTGVMIWHINENLRYASSGKPLPDIFSEKRKREDVECAIGMYDTSGAWPGVKTPCPELGYDPIDNFYEYGDLGSYDAYFRQWFDNAHNGRPRGEWDFFPYTVPQTSNSFTHLSNPSSNAYNLDQGLNFVYGAGCYQNTYCWNSAIDWLEEYPPH
ncbi:MAG: hypothetical protein HY769_07600, partial [Candidatus Stahlbacteria bacterium]|nr:hypothetical protein [Candidatus Stahlbacteria bacterium]